MTINFLHIPDPLRVPGFYIEFNNRLAAFAQRRMSILLLGQQLSTATVPAATINQMTREDQFDTYYGAGAMLSEMGKHVLRTNPGIEVFALGLEDAAGGAQATGSIQVTGAATASGTLYVSIAGYVVQVAVANGDAAATIATAIVAAIQANTALPVTAVLNVAAADLTCKWDGETGNDIDLRTWFISGGNRITAVPITITAMNGGAVNPDIGDAIAAMGDEWYNWIVCPWTDATNLTALEAELASRWQPPRQIGGRAFIAHRGNFSATTTFGNSRNSALLACMPTNIAPSPPYLWAAVVGAVSANSLSLDPGLPLQTLALPGITGADKEVRFNFEERHSLYFDGMGNHVVDRDGTVRIERIVTMYQTDTSYLNIQTPELLDRMRWETRMHFALHYGRHKLGENGTQFGGGQPVMTPNLARSQYSGLYRRFENRAWVEDHDTYIKKVLIYIGDGQGGGDRDRLNVLDHPDLINQFRVLAQQTQFKN